MSAALTDGHEAPLTIPVGVFDSDCERILERTFGIGERNPVLLQIGRGLRRVVLEPHALIIYILYICCNRLFGSDNALSLLCGLQPGEHFHQGLRVRRLDHVVIEPGFL